MNLSLFQNSVDNSRTTFVEAKEDYGLQVIAIPLQNLPLQRLPQGDRILIRIAKSESPQCKLASH